MICHPEQRALFRTGILASAWAKAYPMLFDQRDLAMAIRQPLYHFWEWAAAIHLYHMFGYHSLVEQYQFIPHSRKRAVVKKLQLPVRVDSLLFQNRPGPQGPDLLVFKPDYSEWFFCEVKGPLDTTKKKQGKLFDELSAVGPPVRNIKGVFQDWEPLPST
jgi:hypothetical protein